MIDVGVVGYGYSGRSFHTYLIGLAEGLKLSAIVEPNESLRELAKNEKNVATYSCIEEMLDAANIDMAVVATPHHTHAPLTIQLLKSGINVVTDKAMCLTTTEADAMIDAANVNGRTLSVFHNRRWDWDFNTVMQVVSQGLIGELLHWDICITHGRPRGWRASVSQSGGLFYDWASHLVDQSLLLADSRPKRVFAHMRNRDGCDEHGHISIGFDNDRTCSIEVGGGPGALLPKPHWYVLGTKGCLVKTGIDPQEQAMRNGDIDAAQECPEDRARIITNMGQVGLDTYIPSVRTSWKSFYANISEVLNGEHTNLAVRPEQVRDVVAVLEASVASATCGQSIVM